MACRYCILSCGSRITEGVWALKSLLLGVSSSSPAQPFFYLIAMTLTPMQETAAAAVEKKKNILLLSPTGSGKTLAYLLPVIKGLDPVADRLQAVVVLPSRELALQVEAVFKENAPQFRGMSLYGGRPAMEEHRRLREIKPHIVFATPGRLLDHIGKGNLRHLSTHTIVVDEYDKCLELGFRDEMDRIGLEFANTPQVILTSATRFEAEKQTDQTSAELSTSPTLLKGRKFQTIDYLDDNTSLQERLSICTVRSPEKDKLDTLARLLTHIRQESVIVFVSHRESAERIGRFLSEASFPAVVYHGGMPQDMRERALYRFRAGAATILVSTDLAARGLDIPMVRAIVHYHLPLDEASFTHRSGRTARWEDTGTAYLLISPDEAVPDFVKEHSVLSVDEITPRPCRPEWTVLYIGRGKKDKLSKADVLGFLCKKGGLNAERIGRIDLADHAAYAAVKRSALNALLKQIGGEKIKGMKTIIEEMKR